MKGPFFTIDEARAAARPGDEIWARDSRCTDDRCGWCVMTKDEADEYIAKTPFKEWSHWENVK